MTAPLVNILVAHWLEAKPLVRQLGLRQQSGKPHRLFGNDQELRCWLLDMASRRWPLASATSQACSRCRVLRPPGSI